MRTLFKYIPLIVSAAVLCSCVGTKAVNEEPPLPPVKYPYKATPEKEQKILANMKKLKKGMTMDEVVKLMGKPDEKTYIYLSEDAMNDNKPVSFCLIYLIQRNNDRPSLLERNEKLLRVHFNMSNQMIRTEKVGIK